MQASSHDGHRRRRGALRAMFRALADIFGGVTLLIIGLLVLTTSPRNRIADAVGWLLVRLCPATRIPGASYRAMETASTTIDLRQ